MTVTQTLPPEHPEAKLGLGFNPNAFDGGGDGTMIPPVSTPTPAYEDDDIVIPGDETPEGLIPVPVVSLIRPRT